MIIHNYFYNKHWIDIGYYIISLLDVIMAIYIYIYGSILYSHNNHPVTYYYCIITIIKPYKNILWIIITTNILHMVYYNNN